MTNRNSNWIWVVLAMTPIGVIGLSAAETRADQGPTILQGVNFERIGEFESGLAERASRVATITAEFEDAVAAAEKAPPDRRRLLEAVATARFREAVFTVAKELRGMSGLAGEVSATHMASIQETVRGQRCPHGRQLDPLAAGERAFQTEVELSEALVVLEIEIERHRRIPHGVLGVLQRFLARDEIRHGTDDRTGEQLPVRRRPSHAQPARAIGLVVVHPEDTRERPDRGEPAPIQPEDAVI